MSPCTGNLPFLREVVDHDAVGQTVGGLARVVVDDLVGYLNFQIAEVDFAISIDTWTAGPSALGGNLLHQSDYIVGLLLEKRVEGLRLGRILPVSEANRDGKDELAILYVNADEQSGIFAPAGEVVGTEFCFDLGAIGLSKSALDRGQRNVARSPLDVEFAIGSPFDTLGAGLKHGAEETEVDAVARLDQEGVLVEGKLLLGEKLENAIKVLTQSLRKVGVGERGVL